MASPPVRFKITVSEKNTKSRVRALWPVKSAGEHSVLVNLATTLDFLWGTLTAQRLPFLHTSALFGKLDKLQVNVPVDYAGWRLCDWIGPRVSTTVLQLTVPSPHHATG
jgi:hypothetical protein